MGMFQDAFISYGRADSKAFTTELNRRLIDQNLRVWVDFDGIPFGVDYQKQIADGIDKADNFLFIISPHSVNSPHCRQEIELAVQRNKRIIPILHVSEISRETWQQRHPNGTDTDWVAYRAKGLSFGDDRNPNMHPTIARINWIAMREGIDNQEASFKGLLELLDRHKEYVRHHTYLLDRALEWEQHRKQTRYLLIGEERRTAEEWLRIRFKAEQPPCTPSDLHCEFITESTKNANNLMSQVFLSHAEDDAEITAQVRRSLLREGLTVWTNRTDIATGHDFEAALKQGIEQADNIVYLLSTASLQSAYCQTELQYAFSLNKRIIPLLINTIDTDNIPNQLRNVQFINLIDNATESDYLQGESQLLKILYDDAPYYETHKALLVKALKWQQQSHNSSILLRGYNLRHAEAWLKMGQMRSLHPPLPLQETFIQKSLEQPPDAAVEVFISYSRIDSDFARRLNDQLQIQGKTTWFDQESIAAGADFQQEIYRGIETSDNFLFIISPASVNSPYCADEVEYAAKLNKRFITVLHRSIAGTTLHPELAKVQRVDFKRHNGNFYANFSELIRTLDTDRDYVHSHTKWSLRSLEWQEKNQSQDLLLRGSEAIVASEWLQDANTKRKQPPPTDLQTKFIDASKRLFDAEAKQEKRRVAVLRVLLGLMSAAFVVAIFQFWKSETVQERQIQALSRYSMVLKDNHQDLQALVEGIRAARSLQNLTFKAQPNTQNQVVKALQKALYEINQVHSLTGHQKAINSVSVSPDGEMVATASDDKTVKLWSMSGQEIRTLEDHESGVWDVAFSLDGQTVASSNDGTVRLWHVQDTSTPKVLKEQSGRFINVSFSPDGQTLAAASNNGTATLWDKHGTFITTLPYQGIAILDISFSPDSQIIATALGDGKISLWRRDGQPMGTFQAHEGQAKSVAFSPTGSFIATAGDDKTAKLWTVEGRRIRTFEGHTDTVSRVRVSSDGQRLITASDDKTVKIWTVGGQEIQTLQGHTDVIADIVFNSQYQTIITASRSDRTIKLWRDQVPEFKPLKRQDATINSVSFSQNGKWLATGNNDGTTTLWDATGQERRKLIVNREAIASVSFTPNSQFIATAGMDEMIRVWNITGQPVKTIEGLQGDIWAVAFSPDGKTLATGGADGTVKLWHLDGLESPALLDRQDTTIRALSFSRDGTLLAVGSDAPIVKIWNLKSRELQTLTHDGAVYSVQFSPDGKKLAAGSTDNLVWLWSLDRRSPIRLPHAQTINTVSFSPDGKFLATGDYAGIVHLWSVDGQELKTLQGHHEAVFSLSFSPDGQTLATAGEDRSVRLWRIDKNQLNQMTQFWTLDLNGLVARGCQWARNYLIYSSDVDESDRTLCQKF